MAYNDRALCRCGISIPSARNQSSAFDKDKYLEPMISDVGQAPNKSPVMQNCQLLQLQAALAQNPLLPAVPFFKWVTVALFTWTYIKSKDDFFILF